MSNRKKSSSLWNHFDEIVRNKKAKCHYCSRILSINSSSIGSLKRHLSKIHSTIDVDSPKIRSYIEHINIDRIIDDETEEPSCSTKLKRVLVKTETDHLSIQSRSNKLIQRAVSPLSDYVAPKKTLSKHRTQQLDEQLVRMIVKGYHDLGIVEEAEFQKFVEMLNSGYTVPTQKTLSESLLPRVYNQVLDNAKIQISKAEAICITTDCWTSHMNERYIAITAHFINTETHKLCSVMIGCIQYERRHTSVNLKNFLEAKFIEWNIYQHVNVIVSDSAPNIRNAVRLGGWHSLLCYAHSINTVVQLSLNTISETVHRVRAIVEYFHCSIPATKRLSEMQDQMQISSLKLKQDVATRWNSTYEMLVRILQIKEALITTLDIMRPELNLPEEDWTVIEKAAQILKIFYEVTVEVSGEQYVPASKYIVYCKIINRTLDKYSGDSIETIEALLDSIKTQMNQKFGEVEKNTLLCEATILDPRFKRSGFSDIRNFDRAASELKLKISSDQTTESSQEVVPQLIVVQYSGNSGSIWDDFDAENAILVPQNPTAAGIVEFEKYMEEPLITRTENPLLWWKEREGVYPRLYKYMRKRLNIMATSVPCQRMFSKAGAILNERRTRLKTKQASQFIFISYN